MGNQTGDESEIRMEEEGCKNSRVLCKPPHFSPQLRVSSSSCKVSSRLSIQLKSCVSDFSSATEDRVPFGPLAGGMNKFVYKDSSEFGCGSSQCLFSGPITKISYPAGGYIVSLATYAEVKVGSRGSRGNAGGV
eukprot:764092-Hanusia_phi.AAC.1